MNKKNVFFGLIFSIILCGGVFYFLKNAQADVEESVSVIRQSCDGYSNCYTTLYDWENAYGGIDFGSCTEGDLVCAGKVAIAKIEGSWTKADTRRLSLDGWTTDETHYIKIFTTSDARHDGKWNTSKYRLFPTAITQYNLEIHEDYTQIDGLAVGRDGGITGVIIDRGVVLIDGAKYVRIDNTIVRQYNAEGPGIYLQNNSDYFYGKNNLVYDCSYGFYFVNSTDSRLYNCSAVGNQRGYQISSVGDTLYLKNCLSSGGSVGFVADVGIMDVNYCASSDSTADNFGGVGNIINQDFSFVSHLVDDFHLLATDMGARNRGADLSNDANCAVIYDVDGARRPGEDVWDIGFDEYGEAPVVVVDKVSPIIISGSPAGELLLETKTAVISVITDENATCRFALTPDLDYMEMIKSFSTVDGYSHTKNIDGLENGRDYKYYIKCKDIAGNLNVVDYEISFSIAEAVDLSSSVILEGDMIRAVGDIDVYIVKYVGNKKFKRLILSPSVFNSYGHLKWESVKQVSQATMDLYTTSDLVRMVDDSKVYKLYPNGDTGQKRWVETEDVFNRMGYDWDSIYEINQVDRDSYNAGESIK